MHGEPWMGGGTAAPQPRDGQFWGCVSHWFYTTGGSSHCGLGSSLHSQFAHFLTVAVCVIPITLKPRGVQLHTGLWEEFYLPGCEQMSLSPDLSRCVLPVVEPGRAPGHVVASLLSWIPPAVFGELLLCGRFIAEFIYLLLSVFFSFLVFS